MLLTGAELDLCPWWDGIHMKFVPRLISLIKPWTNLTDQFVSPDLVPTYSMLGLKCSVNCSDS
jgi:hypothetical protein